MVNINWSFNKLKLSLYNYIKLRERFTQDEWKCVSLC
jgi:hypothetical protein